ncbi:SPIC [Branchiostoma lanceolatum]|uniref:SPIC protein n=2 Tax=Branchiostoma lanceolatum TaxID=7740 RepID=A0A8K0EM40_BRALA|nr:SPIC [Branchiostoma lanceolatum]
MAAVDIHLPYKLDRFAGTFKSRSKCRGSKQLLMMMDSGFERGACNDWPGLNVPHSQQGPSMSKIAELTRLSIEQSTTEGSTTLFTCMETRYTALPSCSDVMSGGILTTDGSSANTLVGAQLDSVLDTCLTDLNRSKKRDMCCILSLSDDVASWTPQNVHDWLEWAGKEHGLPQEELAQALTNFDNQQLTGLELCSLSLESFCLLFPRDSGGDIVYGLLQDWKDDLTETFTTAPPYAPPTFPADPDQTHPEIIIGNPMLSGQVQWSAPSGYCLNSTDPRQRYGSVGTCSTGTISPDVSSSTDGCCSQTVKIEISDTEEDDEIDLNYLRSKGWRNPVPTTSRPGYPKKRRSGGQPILWLFLHDCLAKPEEWSHAIKWINRKEGIFQFSSEHKEKVAIKWGEIKGNRCTMSYQKMARSLRNYSNNNFVMKKVRRKLQYQFLPQWIHV